MGVGVEEWGVVAYQKMHLRGKILGAEEKVEFRAAGLGQAVRAPLSPRRGVGQCQDWDVLAKPSIHYRQHPKDAVEKRQGGASAAFTKDKQSNSVYKPAGAIGTL